MALNNYTKVPLPENGIIVRKQGKYKYVYKVLRAYRDENGQPTNDRKAIGKLDTISGMLIPNAAYWEFYGDSNSVEQELFYKTVRSVGATFFIHKTLEKLGVIEIMVKTFGEFKASVILSCAIYMVCRGNVFELATHWCEEFTLNESPLTSQGTSRLFSSITFEEKMAFFRSWIALCRQPEYLAYDVTSFSTYSDGISDAEYGYNRDKEKLPQINFACYLGQSTGMPMFYVTYPGSIVDKSHLQYMMAYNAELGIEDVSFVMDRAFCVTPNIKYMRSEKLPFICGAEIGHKAAMAALNKVRDGIMSMRNVIGQGLYAKSVKAEFYGVASTLHIYLDADTAERQRQDLFKTVEAEDNTLAKTEQLSKKELKSYSKHFDISVKKDGTFTHTRNYDKIDKEAENCGYFSLLTNTTENSEESLSIYRRKDVIEKGFDELKNHIEMKRLRTHNSNTTDGKMFCAFIALIAVSSMNQKLSGFMKDNSFTKNTIISELEKIKVITMTNNARVMNPITKTQRTILESCDITENDLKAYIQ